MDYIVKIVINNDLELYSKPYDSTANVDWSEVCYISNPILKDSTSLSSALAFGGMASNSLVFDIVNPEVEVLENSQIELFLKGADTGNLPQGNQRTDNGEFSINVTPDELIDTPSTSTDEDYVSLIDYGDRTTDVDDTLTEEVPEIPLPSIFTEGDDNTDIPTEILDDTNPPSPYYNGDTITEIVDGGTDQLVYDAWSQLGGVFNVIAVRRNNNTRTITVECLDQVASLSNDIYTPTENGISVEDMFDDLVTQCDETYDIDIGCEVSFPSDVITMPPNTSFRDALGYFAGLVGGFVTVNDYGTVVIKPYSYSNEEVHCTDFIGKGFNQESQSAIAIGGITCDTAVGREEDLVSVYDGGDAWFENPFMTEEILEEYVWTRVRNLQYYSGTLQCKWHFGMRAGEIMKIYPSDEDARRNYYINVYNHAETDQEREDAMAEIEACGIYIVNTNQTIDLVAGNTTISSLGQNKTQQANTAKTKTYKQIQRTYGMANDAQQVATEANTIATATNQHFWNQDEVSYFESTDTTVDSSKTYYSKSADTYTAVTPIGNENPSSEGWYEALGAGAYVTEQDQDTFLETPTGKNSLWNSLGMLFRNGLKNLLAIVTGAETGMVIYDGQGNSANNVIASFTNEKLEYNVAGVPTFRVKAGELNQVVTETVPISINTFSDHWDSSSGGYYVWTRRHVYNNTADSPINVRYQYHWDIISPFAEDSGVDTDSVDPYGATGETIWKNNGTTIAIFSYTFNSNDNSLDMSLQCLKTLIDDGQNGMTFDLDVKEVTYRVEGRAGSTITAGVYPDDSINYLFKIGNGISSSEANNAFTVDWNGVIASAGDVEAGGGVSSLANTGTTGATYRITQKGSNFSTSYTGDNLYGTISHTHKLVGYFPIALAHYRFGYNSNTTHATLQNVYRAELSSVASGEAVVSVGRRDMASSGSGTCSLQTTVLWAKESGGTSSYSGGGSGGGSGTTNYNNLTNKPQIEGVTLVGNSTFSDLSLTSLTDEEIDELLEE